MHELYLHSINTSSWYGAYLSTGKAMLTALWDITTS